MLNKIIAQSVAKENTIQWANIIISFANEAGVVLSRKEQTALNKVSWPVLDEKQQADLTAIFKFVADKPNGETFDNYALASLDNCKKATDVVNAVIEIMTGIGVALDEIAFTGDKKEVLLKLINAEIAGSKEFVVVFSGIETEEQLKSLQDLKQVINHDKEAEAQASAEKASITEKAEVIVEKAEIKKEEEKFKFTTEQQESVDLAVKTLYRAFDECGEAKKFQEEVVELFKQEPSIKLVKRAAKLLNKVANVVLEVATKLEEEKKFIPAAHKVELYNALVETRKALQSTFEAELEELKGELTAEKATSKWWLVRKTKEVATDAVEASKVLATALWDFGTDWKDHEGEKLSVRTKRIIQKEYFKSPHASIFDILNPFSN